MGVWIYELCVEGGGGGVDRHDSPEEKAQDEIRAEICASHRFNSFAGERSQNFVKW